MCVSPNLLHNGSMVACRKCWQCRSNKIDDWVGRNIAESKTATASHVLTLTYGDKPEMDGLENVRAAVLTYSDVQKFFKLLRSDGFRFRYFAVGEYGTKKGRAHWHIIIYWQGDVPEHRVRLNFMQKHWPHGWSFWDRVDEKAIRYACKYLAPDPDEQGLQGFGPQPSKNPPLGDAYFRQLAVRYAKAGLSPQELSYSFPEVIRNGKPIKFRMQRHTAENFLRYLIDAWEKYQGDYPPLSEPLQAFEARRVEKFLDDNREFVISPTKYAPRPTKPPVNGGPVKWHETRNCFYSDTPHGRFWYSYDETEGLPLWQEKISPSETGPIKRKASRFLDPSDPLSRQRSYRSQSNGE